MTHRERVELLFEEALELTPERRRDFVVAACGTDEHMRAAVLALLNAHSRAGVLDVAPDRLFQDRDAPPRIGVYRVLREIGRGGMGTVYDAERDDGQFRRRVAIKIIRGTPDAELLHRVLAERQILAALDHPNIARLLDGGVTGDGRPYLVMEHVDGLPVDVYCDRMRLSVSERLQLFTVIARAVEFAHRNLVVHRDLKPSNILVTPDGRVKLLDFGVAKLLNPGLVHDTPVTRERRALTVEYASPEQLRGEGLTTVSDVYSLGVVLYELLSGRRPCEQHEASLSAHVMAVCDGAIERASARVLVPESLRGASGRERVIEPEALARARQTTPARLARQLQGDVDAILDMALRVEPHRRYGSAELFAQDVEHYLQHQPVMARQASRTYELRKLLRRHRAPASIVALSIFAVLVGAAAAVWQARVANRERARAEAALAHSQQVSDFVLGLFQTTEEPLVMLTARDLVRRGTSRIEQLNEQPDVQAQVLGALARIYESMGEYEEGQRAAERAIAILSARGESGRTIGELLAQQGVLLRRRGEYDSAQAAFARAEQVQRRLLAPDDPALARTLGQLANIAVYRGDFAEAERRARATLAEQERTLGAEHRLTVNTLSLLGTIQRARGDRAGAEATLRRAVELRPRTTGSTRFEEFQDRFQLATTIFNDGNRTAEAEALFRAELARLRTDVPEDLYYITWAEGALGDLAERRGDIATSVRMRRHVLELRTAAFGSEHPSTAEASLFLGNRLLGGGAVAEGEQYMRAAAATYRRVLGERHPSYALSLVLLTHALIQRKQFSEADSLVGIATAIRADRYGMQSHGYLEGLRMRAEIRTHLRDFATAETLLVEALERTRALTGADDTPETRTVHRQFARLYDAWGRPTDAARHRAFLN